MSTKKDKFSYKDKVFMNLALDLAKSREGLTGTNPAVGCIIVKNDEIISIGRTSINGRPHAEVNAIRNCHENLENSTMYVTLEPCSHQGLTPPCTNEILKSKISKIIYSVLDVDKRVKGKSFKILKNNKINTHQGLLKNEVNKFYEPYFFNRKKKLPYVSGKIAITRNNFIYSKGKKKFTNSESNKFTHLLRLKNDSILITYKTLNIDNPKLDCRLRGLKKFSPKRIILDNKLKTNTRSYLFKTANQNNTIIFYNEATKSKILEFSKKKINLIKSKIGKNKNFDMKRILKILYSLGCRNLLVEGGNDLTKNLLNKKIFNKFYLYKSPKKFSKTSDYIIFNGLDVLKKNYKIKLKINSNFGKDKITMYKR